jgi:hypothetical protein
MFKPSWKSSVTEILEEQGIATAVENCRFSETAMRALGRYSMGGVGDYDDLKMILDEYAVAQEEIIKTRVDAEFIAADIQHAMRKIQGKYWTEGIKPTLWERAYKADPKHAELETALAKSKATVEFCDSALGILSNRFFILNGELRQLDVPRERKGVI